MIRIANPADFDALGQVMFDAVHCGPSPYSAAQRTAWLAAPPSGAAWHEKLAAQCVVAGFAQGAAVGFMTLRPDGYLDLAYIIPAARGAGLFRKLYAELARHATARALPRIRVHASLMAQPAFASLGFSVLQHEVVERAGQSLARAEMEKRL
jgi:putative acetyltransferase